MQEALSLCHDLIYAAVVELVDTPDLGSGALCA